MPMLDWGAPGERFYETGVDRGVLYIDGGGVPWNGLISVSESPTGGDTKAYYQDGVKYRNRSAPEEFEADITAYTYPVEFAECDGSVAVTNGLFATQGRRKKFSMAYRTGIGNDLEGLEHGYKIHLIYDALAAPSSRDYATVGDSGEALNFTWHLTTKSPVLADRRPASHFVIDSRITPKPVLDQLESILYGNNTDYARLPQVDELYYLFESFNVPGYDGGSANSPVYNTLDAGVVPEAYTRTVDGGTA